MGEEFGEKKPLNIKNRCYVSFFTRFGPINSDGMCEALYFLSKQKHDRSHDVIFD